MVKKIIVSLFLIIFIFSSVSIYKHLKNSNEIKNRKITSYIGYVLQKNGDVSVDINTLKEVKSEEEFNTTANRLIDNLKVLESSLESGYILIEGSYYDFNKVETIKVKLEYNMNDQVNKELEKLKRLTDIVNQLSKYYGTEENITEDKLIDVIKTARLYSYIGDIFENNINIDTGIKNIKEDKSEEEFKDHASRLIDDLESLGFLLREGLKNHREGMEQSIIFEQYVYKLEKELIYTNMTDKVIKDLGKLEEIVEDFEVLNKQYEAGEIVREDEIIKSLKKQNFKFNKD